MLLQRKLLSWLAAACSSSQVYCQVMLFPNNCSMQRAGLGKCALGVYVCLPVYVTFQGLGLPTSCLQHCMGNALGHHSNPLPERHGHSFPTGHAFTQLLLVAPLRSTGVR